MRGNRRSSSVESTGSVDIPLDQGVVAFVLKSPRLGGGALGFDGPSTSPRFGRRRMDSQQSEGLQLLRRLQPPNTRSLRLKRRPLSDYPAPPQLTLSHRSCEPSGAWRSRQTRARFQPLPIKKGTHLVPFLQSSKCNVRREFRPHSDPSQDRWVPGCALEASRVGAARDGLRPHIRHH